MKKYFKIRFVDKPQKSAGRNYLTNRALGFLSSGEFNPRGDYIWGLVFNEETFNAPEVQLWLKKYGKQYYFEYCEGDEEILNHKQYHPI